MDYLGENKFRNGSLDFWQRGTSFTSAPKGFYYADRIIYTGNGAMVYDLQASSTVPTFSESKYNSQFSLRLEVTTADAVLAASDNLQLRYLQEGYDFRELNGQMAVLSFWVRSDTTGIYCVAFQDSIRSQSYVVEYTINSIDTWEWKHIVVDLRSPPGTFTYDNTKSLHVFWCLGTGTDRQTATKDAWHAGNFIGTSSQTNLSASVGNNIHIAQIDFRPGITASPFIRTGIGTFDSEQELIQRYYETSFALNQKPQASVSAFSFPIRITNALGAGHFINHYKVRKIQAATVTLWNESATAVGTVNIYDGTGSSTVRTPTLQLSTETGWDFFTVVTGTVARCNWEADSELT